MPHSPNTNDTTSNTEKKSNERISNDTIEKRWTRNCIDCGKERVFTKRKNYTNSKKYSRCYKCGYKNREAIREKKYTRVCPECNLEVSHTDKRVRDKCLKRNISCLSCVNKGENNPAYGKKHSNFRKQEISKRHKGKITSEETKLKMSIARKGKIPTEETRKKMRLARLRDLENKYGHQVRPNYNKSACQIFNEINDILGWKGVHAENGGEYHIKELGYWVDYYEPTLNIVIEYDEPLHKHKELRDMSRQQQITEILNCKFYRIKENQDWKEVINEYRTNTNRTISGAYL